jgi:hypothetical protein
MTFYLRKMVLIYLQKVIKLGETIVFVGVLKVTDENSSIQSRIHWSEARIRIRTKMSRSHNFDVTDIQAP